MDGHVFIGGGGEGYAEKQGLALKYANRHGLVAGATGTGRLPDDPETLKRIVAAFNGAFKTEHGAYGMMVEGNVLLPPQDEAATIATYEDGTVVMGSWPKLNESVGRLARPIFNFGSGRLSAATDSSVIDRPRACMAFSI